MIPIRRVRCSLWPSALRYVGGPKVSLSIRYAGSADEASRPVPLFEYLSSPVITSEASRSPTASPPQRSVAVGISFALSLSFAADVSPPPAAAFVIALSGRKCDLTGRAVVRRQCTKREGAIVTGSRSMITRRALGSSWATRWGTSCSTFVSTAADSFFASFPFNFLPIFLPRAMIRASLCRWRTSANVRAEVSARCGSFGCAECAPMIVRTFLVKPWRPPNGVFSNAITLPSALAGVGKSDA